MQQANNADATGATDNFTRHHKKKSNEYARQTRTAKVAGQSSHGRQTCKGGIAIFGLRTCFLLYLAHSHLKSSRPDGKPSTPSMIAMFWSRLSDADPHPMDVPELFALMFDIDRWMPSIRSSTIRTEASARQASRRAGCWSPCLHRKASHKLTSEHAAEQKGMNDARGRGKTSRK